MATALSIVKKFFPGVKKVVDGKKPLQVEVTQQDSTSATKKNHKGCALAVACKRAEKMDGVIVSVGRAYLIKGDTATRYKLPGSAGREVVSFDRGGGFAPGVYELSKPDKPVGEHRHSPDNRGSRSRYFRHTTENIRVAVGRKGAA